MIIRTELLQDSCAKILNAVDSNVLSAVTETLEITCKDNVFALAVTNREYFVEVKMKVEVTEEFHATVNANLFLKLIAKVTSETIELASDGNSLHIKCNGNYKLPLIYDGEALMTLPRINIEEVNESVDIESTTLHTIVSYNSKELSKGTISRAVQRLYYLDREGAVTFTTGACVNQFAINMSSKLLLNDKLVKLFKLFKDTKVKMTVGHNRIGDNSFVNVAKFEAPNIEISAVLNSDEKMFVEFPVAAIRGRANVVYPMSVSINKDSLIQAIDRLMLFTHNGANESAFSTVRMNFNAEGVVICDQLGVNTEQVLYSKSAEGVDSYSALIDSNDLTKTLQSCTNQIVQISFGNNEAFTLAEGTVRWVLPECQDS